CTARICSILRCAVASRSFSSLSKAEMSGFAAHTGSCVCAGAFKAAADDSAAKPITRRKYLKLVVNDMISPRRSKSIPDSDSETEPLCSAAREAICCRQFDIARLACEVRETGQYRPF